jgi:glutathione S-transferase
MSERLLYDLAARDERVRFSPYCWRIRMALAHKGLAVRTVAWRFTEKHRIAFAQTERVPVLVDGDTVVADSMAIADYLEQHYPEQPLFGGAMGRAHAMFIRHWTESVLFPLITRRIVAELAQQLHPMDAGYFRSSREQRLGMTLEAFCATAEIQADALNPALQPLRTLLASASFIGGDSPSYADYIVFAAFQWARCGTGRHVLAAPDPVAAWFDRVAALYGGLGADAPCATPVALYSNSPNPQAPSP